MIETRARQAIKLANECLRAMAVKTSPIICKPYSDMICIHPRYLPTCKGCKIKAKKEAENESV